MPRPLACLLLLALPACGQEEPLDTAPPDTNSCGEAPEGFVLAEGAYTLDIEEIVSNGCENDAGNGLHIHLHDKTPMEIAQDGTCLEAVSDPGNEQSMPMTGSTDGAAFALTGDVELSVGTCILNVHAVMTGTLTADSTFDYRMDGTLSVKEELYEDACTYIVGDGEEHTFPELPCDQAWTGSGMLEE